MRRGGRGGREKNKARCVPRSLHYKRVAAARPSATWRGGLSSFGTPGATESPRTSARRATGGSKKNYGWRWGNKAKTPTAGKTQRAWEETRNEEHGKEPHAHPYADIIVERAASSATEPDSAMSTDGRSLAHSTTAEWIGCLTNASTTLMSRSSPSSTATYACWVRL